MKNRGITLCVLLLAFTALNASAQNTSASRPSLFSNYPTIIKCTEAQLNSFFAPAGQHVAVSFNNNFSLEGDVSSNQAKYSNLQTVVIKLPAFNNIQFALSKRIDQNNNPVYIGHLFNSNYADGYELKRNADRTYQFEKIEMEKILPACTQ